MKYMLWKNNEKKIPLKRDHVNAFQYITDCLWNISEINYLFYSIIWRKTKFSAIVSPPRVSKRLQVILQERNKKPVAKIRIIFSSNFLISTIPVMRKIYISSRNCVCCMSKRKTTTTTTTTTTEEKSCL